MNKRVWCLYRVSTTKQGTDDDIPAQRKACRDFAEQKGWTVVNEVMEKLSGFKTPMKDRIALAEIKQAATNGEFDILLMQISDRLGRDVEYMFYIQMLYQLGIQVWSTAENEIKAVDHQDSLLNFLRFWQSEGESRKISLRVQQTLSQLNEEGEYVGGVPPFGYTLYDTGEKRNSKSMKTIKKLVIDTEESKIVKLIFSLVLEKGYGSSRIAQYLNDLGLQCRGKVWRHNTIGRILRNPVFMGYKRYDITKQVGGVKSKLRRGVVREEWKLQPYNPELEIIHELDFQKVQSILDKRDPKNIGNSSNRPEDHVPLKSNVLLSGLLVCGYCGGNLTTDYSNKKWVRKDGQVGVAKVYRYKCLHSRNGIEEHSQKQWGAVSLDKQVEDETIEAVRRLKLALSESDKDDFNMDGLDTRRMQLKDLQEQFNEKDKAYKNSEIMFDKLMSTAPDKAMLLLDRMNEYSSARMEIADKIKKVEEEIKNAQMNSQDMEILKHKIFTWEERFKVATDLDSKKTILAEVLQKATAYKHTVDLSFHIAVERLMIQSMTIQEIEDVRTRGEFDNPNEVRHYDKGQAIGDGNRSQSGWQGDIKPPHKDDLFDSNMYKELLDSWANTKSIQFEYTIQRD